MNFNNEFFAMACHSDVSTNLDKIEVKYEITVLGN